MPDTREGDLGTAACYLTVERLAPQAAVFPQAIRREPS